MTNPVMRDSTAHLEAQTSPNAVCSIVVQYHNGPSTAEGLSDHGASTTGVVSWTWQIEHKASYGIWPITVTCSLGDQSATDSINFEVVRK